MFFKRLTKTNNLDQFLRIYLIYLKNSLFFLNKTSY